VGLVQETYIDLILPEEVIQFQLLAADTVGIQVNRKALSVSAVLPYLATKRTMVWRTDREQANPAGRMGTDVKILGQHSNTNFNGMYLRTDLVQG
jgi:hypothetical protein